MAPQVALTFLLCSSAALSEGQIGDRSVSVHFSIDQVGNLTAAQLSGAIEQVGRIWSSAGVSVSTGSYGDPVPPGATKISLRMVYALRKAEGTLILAWTSVTPGGRLTPALFVSVPGVTELLSKADVKGRPFGQRPQAVRDQLIGQAIGRVTAHELGHFLLQRARHAHAGLLRPTYSTNDLIEPWLHPFKVAEADRHVVRREVARLAQLQAGLP
jgi:hypothetical protein